MHTKAERRLGKLDTLGATVRKTRAAGQHQIRVFFSVGGTMVHHSRLHDLYCGHPVEEAAWVRRKGIDNSEKTSVFSAAT